jgi:hypothetical protein
MYQEQNTTKTEEFHCKDTFPGTAIFGLTAFVITSFKNLENN